MKEIQGPWLASCMGIFFGWAFLAWVVRVWAKLRTHVWTLDDYAICGSMNLYVGQIFYIVSLGLCRVSVALFIAYISNSGPHIQPAQALAVVTALWTASSLLVICMRGDIAHPWKVLDGSYTMFRRWLSIEISGIFIELALWGMAAHLVWGIQLKTSKRILIICAFGARLLVVVLVAVRLVFLDPRVNTGPARGATIADFLTEACVHFSIIAGSATTLKPLLMSFYPTDLEPAEASTSDTRSKQRTRGRDPAVSDITWWPMGQGSLNTPALVVKSGNETGSSAARSSTRLQKNSSIDGRQWDAIAGAFRSGGAPRSPPGSSTSDDSGRMMIQKTEVITQHR